MQRLPLAHLSIEVGHLYFEDFAAGPDRLRVHFEQLAPWVDAALAIHRRAAGRTLRVSTCFLIDDYFGPKQPPTEIMPMLLDAAKTAGVQLDYVARESACADADGVALARLVEERIVADPPPGTNGSRPPVAESGWLSNGARSPATLTQGEAMGGLQPWRPPSQNAANRHSIFVDVQLWDEPERRRRWSCAYLASVWQLLRLGLLRFEGGPVAQPRPWEGAWPSDWARLPAVLQVNAAAAPFSAYRSLSVLSSRFFATEQAVRTILSQVMIEPGLTEDVVRRGETEGFELPLAAVDRLQYVFVG